MKKSENGMTDYICLFILSVLFVSCLLIGYCHTNGKIHISQDKDAGCGQILCSVHHMADSAMSEDKAAESSLSLYRKQKESLWAFKARIYIDSFLAVLFKMAIFLCAILWAFHFALNADIFMQRVIQGFIHLQDGKKRTAFSFII